MAAKTTAAAEQKATVIILGMPNFWVLDFRSGFNGGSDLGRDAHHENKSKEISCLKGKIGSFAAKEIF